MVQENGELNTLTEALNNHSAIFFNQNSEKNSQ